MPRYRWGRDDPFRDHAHNREINTGEIVELSETIAENQPGFTRVADDNPKGATGEDTDAQDEAEASDTDEGENRDYAAMDYAELRQLAADAETDEIDGRSPKAEIVEFFSDS